MTAAGTATLYSWSVVRRNDVAPFGSVAPYIPALVDLTEGCRMMTRIVDASPGELAIDQPVAVCFLGDADAADDDTLRIPFFRTSQAQPQAAASEPPASAP